MGSSATENGIPMLHHGLSIPELVKFIRYSFLERDYNEVQSIFMGREKKQYMEMENLRRERDSIKEEAKRNQSLAELEKLKLKRYERRCQKLKETVRMLTVEQMPFSNKLKLKRENDCDYDNVYEEQPKMASDKNESIVELNEKINELKKQNLESEELVRIYQEKLRSADMKLVEMEQVITDLRQEKSTVNETLEQLRKRQIESDEVVEMLRCKNVEAAKCVDELRAEKMKSDKRSEYYKGWYLKLEGRVMDMERMLSNMLKVNIKDLANVANTIDNASASADGGNVELPDCFRSGKDSLENDKVNVDDFEDVVMSPSLPFLTNSTGSGAVGLPNKGGSNLAQAWKNEDKTNKGEEPHFSEFCCNKSSYAATDIIEICDSDDETNTGCGDLITKKRKRSLVKSDEDNVATVTELTNTSLRHHDADSGGSNLVQSWKNEDNTNKGEEPRISDIIEICDSDDETNAGCGDLITKKRKRSLVKSEEYKIATFMELTNTSLCHHVVDSSIEKCDLGVDNNDMGSTDSECSDTLIEHLHASYRAK